MKRRIFQNRRTVLAAAGRCAACLMAGMLLLCAEPCLAAESPERVRVAVINYPNYLQMNEDGTVGGYAYEYLQDLQKYTGWQYEFAEMSFSEATAALAKGEIDLLPGNQYTRERAEMFDFSARDMGEGGSVLCVLPEDMRYCYNDYASYEGLRIAALAGSIRIEQTRSMLAEFGVNAAFVEYNTDEESKAALESGIVDAVLMSTIRCETQYKMLARINSAPLYFCTNRRRPELKTELDRAMERIHLESPYYEERLDSKYYGGIPTQLAFTQEEKDYIAAAGPIRVAVSDDLTPVEYYSAEDGGYRGVVPDSFQLISQYSGLSFAFVTRKDADTVHHQLKSGEVQLIASVANEPKIAEQWGVELTRAYFDNSVSLVINGDIGDPQSKKYTLVLRTGYPFLEQIARTEGYGNYIAADSFKECVAMVEKNPDTLTLIPSNCADSLTHGANYKNLRTYTVPDSYIDYCIGVSRSADSLLLSVLNKSIASFTREQRAELLIKNVAVVNQKITLKDFLEANRFMMTFAALIVALFLIAGAGYLAITRQRANRKLRAALDKAAAASRAKTDFMARMSHEMRTPMNGILGLSYLMEDQTAQEMKRELPQLRETGEYLLRLINDVLDVNKVENGEIRLQPKVCDERQLFSSIISMLKPQMEKKSIVFNFEKINVEWDYMLLDEQRVKQIFINLLSNAVKFTPDGGRIDFIMEFISRDEHVIRDKFVVRDTGIGMSEEFLPKLFEPFAQENRADGNEGGTGLGLSIVKSLVELMGGTISVKSRMDAGTEFTLYLDFPLAKQPPGTALPAEGLHSKLPSNVKILLCEDQPLNAQIATRLLEKQGASVTWVKNGEMGLEAFADSKFYSFDVILMDIRMPVMDGIAAAKAIRALERPDAKRVPIIAMTANAYEEDVQKSLDAGMNAHLAKPVEPEKLYAALADAIKASHDDGR